MARVHARADVGSADLLFCATLETNSVNGNIIAVTKVECRSSCRVERRCSIGDDRCIVGGIEYRGATTTDNVQPAGAIDIDVPGNLVSTRRKIETLSCG